MDERFSRTEKLIGSEAMERLKRARVAIFGIGGVGGYVAEALARTGIGSISLIDSDKISLSNINRQIIATSETVGEYKAEAMAKRIKSINSEARVFVYKFFFNAETLPIFDLSSYDYIVDAIDTVSSKLLLIEEASRVGTRIISSMGTGNKLDPTRFEIQDIYKTSVCPLARVMRTELKKRGITSLKVLYSKEEPIKVSIDDESAPKTRHAPASIAFVPSAAGLIIASEVVKDLCSDI